MPNWEDMEYLRTHTKPGSSAKVHVVRIGDRVRVMVEDREGLTDWPIRYPNGIIAYDHPERLTRQVRQLVAEAYRSLNEGERDA